MTIVALTVHQNIEHGIHEALRFLDLTFLRGKCVAVKPNETWASVQDCTGVTQPDTLRAVLRRHIKQYAPRELIVTGGAGSAETADVFRIAGLMPVVEDEGAEFFDHNRGPFVSVDLDYGDHAEVRGPQRAVMINPRVLEYEALVAVNQLKLHETATVTLGLKNMAMSFPAADYYGHPRSTQRRGTTFLRTCTRSSRPWQSGSLLTSPSPWDILP